MSPNTSQANVTATGVIIDIISNRVGIGLVYFFYLSHLLLVLENNDIFPLREKWVLSQIFNVNDDISFN